MRSNHSARPLAFALLALLVAALAAVGSALSPPARAQDGPPGRYVDLVFPRVERTDGVTYGTAVDIPSGRPVDLKLDIYEPEGDTAAARPVFMFLFGGGFVAGDRVREPRAYCELMARRGYVAVAIDYRINQGNIATQGIPAAVADARQAVAWVRANAATYRLDAERIAIGGSSAGAITSLFLAYTDLERRAGDDSEVAIVMDLWGGLYTSVDEMTTGEPPLAIIHGTDDNVVPFAEAAKLRARAEAVDIPYTFHPIDGAGHAPYMPAELMTIVATFFHEQLWDAAAPTAAPDTPTAVTATATTVAATATPTLASTAPPTPATPEPTTIPATVASPRWTLYVPSLARDA